MTCGHVGGDQAEPVPRYRPYIIYYITIRIEINAQYFCTYNTIDMNLKIEVFSIVMNSGQCQAFRGCGERAGVPRLCR